MYPVIIQPTQVHELKEVKETNNGIKIGASVTLVEMESALRHQINTKHGKIVVSIILLLTDLPFNFVSFMNLNCRI